MDAASCLFGRVLCAIELAHRSGAALYNAVAFAEPNGHLDVMTVVHGSRDRHPAQVPAATQQALEDFARRHVPSGVPYLPSVDFDVAFGDPAEEILLAASRCGSDLIIMGTRGRGRLLEAAVGSVAHRVLRRAQTPVMVIPPFETELVSLEATRPVFHLGRIIVPVDPYRVNGNQMRVAARLRRTSNHQLLLLHVRHPKEPRGDDAELSRVVKQHNLPEGTAVVSVPAATVAQGIVEAAGREDAGLIVMGLEGDQKRMEPGGISFEVIRRTNAVVLTVPPAGPANTAA